MWNFKHRVARSLTLLLFTSSTTATSSPAQPQRRELDPDATTDPSQFYRRGWHGSVLLGEIIYIDGGEFTYNTSDGPINYPYNSSYSLDLSSSWSPDSVHFNKIDKGDSPVYNTPNMWPASNNQTFYSINGDITLAGQHRADPPATTELWEFVPDSSGSGQWQLASYAPSIIGITRAKSTYGDGSVHILGGFSFDRTSALVSTITKSNGIVSYDMQTGSWLNQSMTPFAPVGFWVDGHIHFVDNLGGNGTVIAFGGATADPNSGNQVLMSFENIGLFNPDTGEWRNQSATGEIPPGRRLACSVGVAGDNGTYEVFVHGGSAYYNNIESQIVPQVTINLDQVWVLSIPSFTWYKSTYNPAVPRWAHTCHTTGDPPRRQMVAIGGKTPDLDGNLETKDPWLQGLGVFDLTEMEWLTSYNASADVYITPNVVKDGISKNGSYPQNWDDPDTPKWLTGKLAAQLLSAVSSSNTGTSNDTSNPRNATNDSSSNNDNDNIDDSSNSNSLSLGAIIGIVIGSMIGIVIILFGLGIRFKWPMLGMMRIRKTQPYQLTVDRWEKPELENATVIRHKGQEMDGVPIVRYEMVGTSGPVELPSEYMHYHDDTTYTNGTEVSTGETARRKS